MSHSSNDKLERVYSAKNDKERAAAYNAWSSVYEADVAAFGITLPYIAAAVFARFTELPDGPFLDAGCGTGMQTLPLTAMGYGPFYGFDISGGMLDIARGKGIYTDLRCEIMGNPLSYDTDQFATIYAIGCLSVGHGPATAFEEFLRVTKPGGHVIFSTHVHESALQSEHHFARKAHEEAGRWQLLFETPGFASMQKGDANIHHAIYVYKVA